jgi:outer membrane protein assembly factor BamB
VTVSEEVVFVGSREDELLALDRANGALLWSFPQEGQEDDGLEGIYASPAVTDDLVLVGGYNGILYALDPSTRQKVWEFQTDDSIVGSPALVYEEIREIIATPTPSFGSAFSVGAPTPTPSFGSAFSVGAPTPTPSDDSPSGQEAVASRLELIIVGSSDGNLYAMDTNGVEQWRFETGNKIWSMPVVYEDVVYFGSLDHNVYAVSLKDTGSLRAGDEMWRFETDGAVAATPLVMNGRVYIGSFDRRFYSLDAFSGQEAWAEPFEAENWFWSKAVSDGATVYVASLDGNLYALDSTSGAERWRFEFIRKRVLGRRAHANHSNDRRGGKPHNRGAGPRPGGGGSGYGQRRYLSGSLHRRHGDKGFRGQGPHTRAFDSIGLNRLL